MAKKGWVFNIDYHKDDDNFAFTENCRHGKTWYGYKSQGIGTSMATFTGSGTAILNYGNCHNEGKVSVSLNGILLDSVDANKRSKLITFDFSPNDVLIIAELGDGIIKLNSLELKCRSKIFSILLDFLRFTFFLFDVL